MMMEEIGSRQIHSMARPGNLTQVSIGVSYKFTKPFES